MLISGLVLIILSIAVFVQSSVGFGQALLAMPLITLLLGIQTATPLVALVGFSSTLLIVLNGRRTINLRETWRLILAALVGLPFGLFLLTSAPDRLVRGLLGLLIIGFSCYNLIKWHLPTITRSRLAFVFGFASGMLGGAYNTSAPPLVIYGVMRRWNPEQFPATLQSVFFPASIFLLLGHALAGLWTPAVLGLYGLALPLILLAVWLGLRLNRSVPRERFEGLIYLLLLVMGGLLLLP
jgi:hypothetical protein